MITGGGKKAFLAALLALGLSASARAGNEGRVFALRHPAPQPGDVFSVEHKTSFVLATVGGSETGHYEAASAFKVRVLAKEGQKLRTRLEMEPSTMMTELSGKAETETAPARTFETLLAPSEISLLPAPQASEGLTALGAKKSVQVGETWTCERSIPFQKTIDVPVKSTYTVAAVEQDAHGHDILKLLLKSEGCLEVGSTGVKVNVSGEGEALVDPDHADRPIRVRLDYRFVTSGGEGADSETRTTTTISTRDLGVAPETSSVSAQEKAR